MDEDLKYYRFINCETGNVIYFVSLSCEDCDLVQKLENIKIALAYEKDMYVGNIHYMAYSEDDFED